MKDKLLKIVRVTLFVFVATVITGCGLLEPEMADKQSVKRDVLKLCGAGSDWSTSDVKVLDWSLNEEVFGDSYTGYLVTYEIGTGYYALVSLIEFDGTSRYEIKLIYRGRSLSDLNEYIIH